MPEDLIGLPYIDRRASRAFASIRPKHHRESTVGVWDKCVKQLKGELTSAEFSTWILPLQARHVEGVLHLFAPNLFVLNWTREHYESRLRELCLLYSDGQTVKLAFSVGGIEPERSKTASRTATTVDGASATSSRKPGNLNANLSFDNFVEGKSNQLARAISIQVGNHPGTAYNPLFIYGGVGLGKTHLMHAIGNRMLESNPDAHVVYLHSERFVAEMIKALQHNHIDAFKRTYRSVNALLIDDVQFFAGKDRSQEEFFHTFNVLLDSKQQIVLSSDRFPKDLAGLEERLKSRFGWGLTVSIDPPDLETRIAILHAKAERLGMVLPEDVAFFLGQHICSNIRELEGALSRLIASSRFAGKSITLDFTHQALRDLLSVQDQQISIENIQRKVAEYYKLRLLDMLSPKRSRSVARPRQIAMALAKELTKHSLPEIGQAFGGRDHTTVLHATKKVNDLRTNDLLVEEDYQNLLRTLTS